MGRKRVGNLVLDIDGTLIDSVPNGHLSGLSRVPDFISEWGDYIYFRPHLESFLLYAFSRFENVAIWTAASPEWAETILRALQPMLRRIRLQTNRKRTGSLDGEESHQMPRQLTTPLTRSGSLSRVCDTDDMFSFVFTKNRCAPKRVTDWSSKLVYEFHTKPLRKVWRSKSWRGLGWNAKNTLILEDTPQNCISNYGNALYIRTYDAVSNRGRDSALLVLPVFLDRIRNVEDVRTIEKRDWERLCASSAAPTLVAPPPLKHAKSSPAVLDYILGAEQHAAAESSSSTGGFSLGGLTLPETQSRFTAFLTPRSRHNRFSSSESYDTSAEEDLDDDYDSASTTDSSDDDSSFEADSSDSSYVSSDDSDAELDRDYSRSSSRNRSLPLTPYVHVMPSLKAMERMCITVTSGAIHARGKGDAEEVSM